MKESESRLLELIRQQEPAEFGKLCVMTGEQLGWRRIQAAGVLRRLIDKGFCVRCGRMLRTAITQEQVDNIEDGGMADFILTRFAGSSDNDEKIIFGGGSDNVK